MNKPPDIRFTPDHVIPSLKAGDKPEVLRELVSHLVKLGELKADDHASVLEAIQRREASMSTGIGFGVACPHTSTDRVEKAVVVVGVSANGIAFDSLDNQPVHLVFLVLIPQGNFQAHLQELAEYAKATHQVPHQLLQTSSTTAQQIYDAFQSALNRSKMARDAATNSISETASNAVKSAPGMSIKFSDRHIIPNLAATERFAALHEMVAHLVNIGEIAPEDLEPIVNLLSKREEAMSTSIGFGIARPHIQLGCINDLVIALGVSPAGIDFNGYDQRPVNLIAMFLVPNRRAMEFAHWDWNFIKNVFPSEIWERLAHPMTAAEIWELLKPGYDRLLATHGEWVEEPNVKNKSE